MGAGFNSESADHRVGAGDTERTMENQQETQGGVPADLVQYAMPHLNYHIGVPTSIKLPSGS